MAPTKHGSWLAVLVAACATAPQSSRLDGDVVAELHRLADVLSRPHDFVAGDCRFGGRGGSWHEVDFGCALPSDFLAGRRWERTGLPHGTWNLALEPEDEPRASNDAVTRACWRIEQLGCVGLFRRELLLILGDAELGAAMRCQAARALGTLRGVDIAVALVRAIGDDTAGAECLGALSRLGSVAVVALRRAGLPDEEPARARAIWLLGKNDDELQEPELRWLVAALASVSHKEAVWALARVCERRVWYVDDLLAAELRRPDPAPAVLALAAIGKVDEPRLRAAALAIVEHGAGVRRQLALQYLGAVASPTGFDAVLACASDSTQPPLDRAAAMLALGGYSRELPRWSDVAHMFLDDGNVHLVRTARHALRLAR